MLKQLADKVLATLSQRGQDNGYDKNPGTAQEERSAAQVARVFNELTGHNLSTTDVFSLLQVLKMCRLQSQIKSGNGDLLDTVTDMVGYSLLKAEAAVQDHRPAQAEMLLGHTGGTVTDCKRRFEEVGEPLPFGGFPLTSHIDTGNHPVLREAINEANRKL